MVRCSSWVAPTTGCIFTTTKNNIIAINSRYNHVVQNIKDALHLWASMIFFRYARYLSVASFDISRPPFEGRQLVPFLLLLVGPILQNQLDSFAWFCVVLYGNESRFSCLGFYSYSHSECAYIKVSLSLLSRMFGTFLFRNLRIIRRIIRHPQPRNLHRVSLLFLRPNDIDS